MNIKLVSKTKISNEFSIDSLSCINPSGGSCPFNASFQIFGESFSLSDYCSLFEELMSYVGVVFILLYSLLAIRIVASA